MISMHHVSKIINYSLSNATILSTTGRSPVQAPTILSHDLLAVYNYTFNDEKIVAENSNATLITLIPYLMYLQSVQTHLYNFTGSNMISYLQAFVAIPLLFFQPGTAVDYYVNGSVPELFPNVTPVAVYSQSSSRIMLAGWSVWTFTAIAGIVYLLCVLCLCWAMKYDSPPTTQFPLLDFFVSLYNRDKPMASLLASRRELNSGIYRRNLEGQVLRHGDGVWGSSTMDGVDGLDFQTSRYCYD